jgi:hypothetical protein
MRRSGMRLSRAKSQKHKNRIRSQAKRPRIAQAFSVSGRSISPQFAGKMP